MGETLDKIFNITLVVLLAILVLVGLVMTGMVGTRNGEKDILDDEQVFLQKLI